MDPRIALVACVKSKRSGPAPSRDLYISPLFRGMKAYAEANAAGWYILSAEHGLLDPDRVIEPYERTMNRMGAEDRRRWAERVQRQLDGVLPFRAEVIILAGQRYRQDLIPFLENRGHSVSVPFEGLSLGHQLSRLNQLNGAR